MAQRSKPPDMFRSDAQRVAFVVLRACESGVDCRFHPDRRENIDETAPPCLAEPGSCSIPTTAFAHTGVGAANGVAHGFMHPFSGLDHVLAMVAVGLLAARLGGRALWLVPFSFVTMMILGGIAGASGIGLPLVELGISGIDPGARLRHRAGRQLPTACRHGRWSVSLPFSTAMRMAPKCRWMPQAFLYGAGFALATALLHAAGLALGGWR